MKTTLLPTSLVCFVSTCFLSVMNKTAVFSSCVGVEKLLAKNKRKKEMRWRKKKKVTWKEIKYSWVNQPRLTWILSILHKWWMCRWLVCSEVSVRSVGCVKTHIHLFWGQAPLFKDQQVSKQHVTCGYIFAQLVQSTHTPTGHFS